VPRSCSLCAMPLSVRSRIVDLKERGHSYVQVSEILESQGVHAGPQSIARHLKTCGKPTSRPAANSTDSNALVAHAVAKVMANGWDSQLTRICAELEYDPAATEAISILLAPCPDYVRSSWTSHDAKQSRADELEEARTFIAALRKLLPQSPAFAADLGLLLGMEPQGQELAQAVLDLASGGVSVVVSAPEPVVESVDSQVIPGTAEGDGQDLTAVALGSNVGSGGPSQVEAALDADAEGEGHALTALALSQSSQPFDYERELLRAQSIGDPGERARVLARIERGRRKAPIYRITNSHTEESA
jgi:hypothetical protein